MSATIAILSDVICPWCYVGKRRLERALDRLGRRGATTIEWLPFELNPDMPEAGIARALYRERKFGAERGRLLDAQMTATGEAEGIAFRFDLMTRTPNTRRAHMLIAGAQPLGLADALVESLFRAYFEEGLDIGDTEVLAGIATAIGLPPGASEASLASDDLRQQVVMLEQRAVDMSISGVPFFIVDGAWAVSGAQDAEAWTRALTERSVSPVV